MPLDAKKFAAALKLGPSKDAPPADLPPDDSEAPFDSAAQDLIDAVKAGDVQGVKDALEAAFRHLDMKEDAAEGEPV